MTPPRDPAVDIETTAGWRRIRWNGEALVIEEIPKPPPAVVRVTRCPPEDACPTCQRAGTDDT